MNEHLSWQSHKVIREAIKTYRAGNYIKLQSKRHEQGYRTLEVIFYIALSVYP